MNRNLVSIIIPAYNSANYLAETVKSVLIQSYSEWELLIIDDGSIDNQKDTIKSLLEDDRIQYFWKENTGVSSTRNYGFDRSKGKYIVFLDADDLLEEDFILSKVKNINDFDFIGSNVKFFSKDKLDSFFCKQSIINNIFENTLLYNNEMVSCPSAYMFRSEFLKENKITFDSRLSSIADREFIIHLGVCGARGILDDTFGKNGLLYRIVDTSMSHQFSRKLIDDNALFYDIIERKYSLPLEIMDKARLVGYKILWKSYLKIGEIRLFCKYLYYYLIFTLSSFIK